MNLKNKIFAKLDNRKKRKRYEQLKPENCWHVDGYETAGTNFICAKCGALVNNTPFGKKVILEDARDAFPRVAVKLDVERWKDPIYALMRKAACG